ncbi:hypothetical protein ACS5NO_09285 [Larkinella sp. GY13]|uniref:hypothetical protein n=1 Tax=Larkinella sp. GY13 TaxID=3453720 RepID=UPI003EEA7B67
MLTLHHLTLLRQDLRTLAHIEYEEVENELLDHYATLTEQKIEAGQFFEYASANAWAELGAGPGLQQIQEEFVKNINKQVSNRHREIVLSYFRWPTLVGTLLLCGLVYQLADILSTKSIYLLMQGLFLMSGLILLYAVIRKQNRYVDSRKLVWQYIGSRANLSMGFLHLTNMVNALLDEDSKPFLLVKSYPELVMGLICILLIYSVTFLQLYRENFSYKTAH